MTDESEKDVGCKGQYLLCGYGVLTPINQESNRKDISNMQCNCGGSSEYEHKVVRDKKVVATYEKCPACGRVLLLTGAFPIENEENEE